MLPEMYSCCKTQPSWIFVYENGEVYSICDMHFNSDAHRSMVKSVMNLKSHKEYLPSLIFEGILLEAV